MKRSYLVRSVIVVLCLLISLWQTEFSLPLLWERGHYFIDTVGRMFPPDTSFLDVILVPLRDTVYISLLGTVFGGIIGVIIGEIVAYVGAVMLKTTYSASVSAIMLGLGFSLAVGIVFGWAPARRASRLNPIDALRAE